MVVVHKAFINCSFKFLIDFLLKCWCPSHYLYIKMYIYKHYLCCALLFSFGIYVVAKYCIRLKNSIDVRLCKRWYLRLFPNIVTPPNESIPHSTLYIKYYVFVGLYTLSRYYIVPMNITTYKRINTF